MGRALRERKPTGNCSSICVLRPRSGGMSSGNALPKSWSLGTQEPRKASCDDIQLDLASCQLDNDRSLCVHFSGLSQLGGDPLDADGALQRLRLSVLGSIHGSRRRGRPRVIFEMAPSHTCEASLAHLRERREQVLGCRQGTPVRYHYDSTSSADCKGNRNPEINQGKGAGVPSTSRGREPISLQRGISGGYPQGHSGDNPVAWPAGGRSRLECFMRSKMSLQEREQREIEEGPYLLDNSEQEDAQGGQVSSPLECFMRSKVSRQERERRGIEEGPYLLDNTSEQEDAEGGQVASPHSLSQAPSQPEQAHLFAKHEMEQTFPLSTAAQPGHSGSSTAAQPGHSGSSTAALHGRSIPLRGKSSPDVVHCASPAQASLNSRRMYLKSSASVKESSFKRFPDEGAKDLPLSTGQLGPGKVTRVELLADGNANDGNTNSPPPKLEGVHRRQPHRRWYSYTGLALSLKEARHREREGEAQGPQPLLSRLSFSPSGKQTRGATLKKQGARMELDGCAKDYYSGDS